MRSVWRANTATFRETNYLGVTAGRSQVEKFEDKKYGNLGDKGIAKTEASIGWYKFSCCVQCDQI